VYKDGTADRALSGDYRLEHNLVSTTVEGSAPAARTALLGAQPSPFRGSTSLAFELASAGPVSLDVFDVSGKKVRGILSGVRAAGRQRADWDGADDSGRRLPNGVYLARLQAGGYSGVLKVVRIN
jgi:flagellar hook assembly protein FlgD